jgi:hypothetical protein
MTTVPGSLSPYVDAVERAVEDLRRQAAMPSPPNLSPITEREFEARIADHPLGNLVVLGEALHDRIVRRCHYNALIMVATALDDVIKAAREENALQRYNDDDRPDRITRFSQSDIRAILADAASNFGLSDQWRAYTDGKATEASD